jgi:hypothetical protein
MALSKATLDTLLDLVEIKLSCMEVWDREDRRELAGLTRARDELLALHTQARGSSGSQGWQGTRPSGGRPQILRTASC